jgi:hypothetical protein
MVALASLHLKEVVTLIDESLRVERVRGVYVVYLI